MNVAHYGKRTGLRRPVIAAGDVGGVGETLVVPSVTLGATMAVLPNVAVATPPFIVKISLGVQPVGERCTVTVPGYKVEQAASMQAFMVTVLEHKSTPCRHARFEYGRSCLLRTNRPRFMSALTSAEDISYL